MRSGLLGSVRMGVVYSAVHPRQIPCTHTVRVCHLEIQRCLLCRSTGSSWSSVVSGLGAPMIFSHVTAIISVRHFVQNLVSKSCLVSCISTLFLCVCSYATAFGVFWQELSCRILLSLKKHWARKHLETLSSAFDLKVALGFLRKLSSSRMQCLDLDSEIYYLWVTDFNGVWTGKDDF
jgi:hypothetical protein